MDIFGMTPLEKTDLAAYQFKGIARIWFDPWESKQARGASSVAWEEF